MEREFSDHLLHLVAAFSAGTGLAPATIGRRAALDSRFFARVADPSVTFTIRKYDEVVAWFAAHWPSDLDWPANVPRPADSPADDCSSPSATSPAGASSPVGAFSSELPEAAE